MDKSFDWNTVAPTEEEEFFWQACGRCGQSGEICSDGQRWSEMVRDGQKYAVVVMHKRFHKR